nr:hypothetical protein [Desulfobulbaceae bacterium]
MSLFLNDETVPFTGSSREKIVFTMKFIGLVIVCFFLLGVQNNEFFNPLNSLNARVLAEILTLLGKKAEVNNELVSAGGFRVKVITECSAVYLMALFGCFVLSFPASARKKCSASPLGFPLSGRQTSSG